MAGFLVLQSRYVQNFVLGPYETASEELDAIKDATSAPRYFVKVTAAKALPTGIQEISIQTRNGRETSRSVSAEYFALPKGNRLLLFKSYSGAATTAIGGLAPIPPDLWTELMKDPDIASAKDRFYPYYVDGDSFRTEGYIAGAILAGILLLAGFNGLPAWRFLQEPATHPLMLRVRSWGNAFTVSASVQKELASPRFSAAGWYVTEQYLIHSTFFTLDVHRLTDLLWIYKTVTQHRVNFIPTGKTYAAALGHSDGIAMLGAKEEMVDRVLDFVAGKAPWAVLGHSEETKAIFDKNRRAFIDGVAKRRQEFLKPKAAEASALPVA